MGYLGRKLRERRILYPDSVKGLIVPIDHGLTLGPIEGMERTRDLHGWIGSSAISAVLAHKGLIERLIARDMLNPRTGVILHLNGMASIAPDADTKVMVASIEAALQLGADAVSLQLNFTQSNFQHNLSMLGTVTDAAHAAGLPVLAMVYDKVAMSAPDQRLTRLSHFIRVAAELAVDAVKLPFPDASAGWQNLLDRHKEDIRIFLAGGTCVSEDVLLSATREAVSWGACGLCVGRNVFQHPRPQALLRRLSACVRGESERVLELDVA